MIIWGGKFRTIHTPLVQTREAWEMQEKRAPARSLSGLAYRKRLQTSIRQVKINRKMGNAIWRFRNMWKRKNGYCTRVGIFWTENAVWYSRGSRFCRFGMRSIGKIRCCLRNAWTVTKNVERNRKVFLLWSYSSLYLFIFACRLISVPLLPNKRMGLKTVFTLLFTRCANSNGFCRCFAS